MSKRNTLHYYEDGDILVTVNDTLFRLHRSFLAMASRVFEDMFACSVPSSNNENISCITLTNISSTVFENLLTFIYPRKYVRISWENIDSLLEIGDKYEITVVIEAAEEFLEIHFAENPLLAFSLADQYGFKYVYKESSKLVLNNLAEFNASQDFQKLSCKAAASLLSKHLDYILAIGNLSGLDVEQDYKHGCSHSITHGCVIHNNFVDKKRSVQSFPVIPPSKLYEILFKFDECDRKIEDCQRRFLKSFFPIVFSSHFGVFEPLETEKGKSNVEKYLFLELN
ncbi:19565_t:CDS:1 [Funneliformis geosporum]|uniref:3341_t:CDS:1 n=1 Tax=Funneliformis geosporum TaxID=1117311 RepID=A0A9W4SNR2_9GLOM|nr:3341_t:CDS:1 [Funneliformis geosporum]CAI2177027.1 19565_t:CDS:1 [Funneliformis geosporum]